MNNTMEHRIHLRIHSPNVLDLTLIDLPGIVRTAVEGLDLSLHWSDESGILAAECIRSFSDCALAKGIRYVNEVGFNVTRSFCIVSEERPNT